PLHRALTLEVDASTHQYWRTRVDLARGPATIGYVYEWRPRDLFYGAGLQSSRLNRSTFAVREQQVRLGLAYPVAIPHQRPPREQIAMWAGPREQIQHRGRERPSFEGVFPSFRPLLDLRQEHFVYGARVVHDTRAGAPHWTHGMCASFQAERF